MTTMWQMSLSCGGILRIRRSVRSMEFRPENFFRVRYYRLEGPGTDSDLVCDIRSDRSVITWYPSSDDLRQEIEEALRSSSLSAVMLLWEVHET